MAASKNSFGLLMDEEYNVFRIENSKGQIVHANNSWSLKMAMYGSTSTEGMVSKKYIINKYSATESFIIRVLVHYIRNCKVKLHTTIQTQQWMTQRFSDIEEYESLQREIKRMEMNHMSEALVLKPQRRSSVCLFRNNCSNYQSCVYCLLEAQKNHVNLKSGIRATKEMCVSKYDQGPLHRVVEDVAAEMRSRRPNVVAKPSSSSSSSSRSCSSSSSSSSEDEREINNEDKGKRTSCVSPKKTGVHSPQRKTMSVPDSPGPKQDLSSDEDSKHSETSDK
ncbi:MAG: hypothetical protein E6K54_08145 [Gammaproteobacteria bacterium]|nr:MAG: hypothetical protein E6K54_08145 [Gammaproteobacteria bacterium]